MTRSAAPSDEKLKIVFCGLSITSSWGNGHATTYRGLVRELVRRGHEVHFLERDKPWYAENRDLPEPPHGKLSLYRTVEEFKDRFSREIQGADAVIVGSFVPEGILIGRWVTAIAGGVTAFYDIDTPVTLANLSAGRCEYLESELVPRYDLYLSFTGGPILRKIERELGAPLARALYCSADVEEYYPERREAYWEMGYLGTYSLDRQPALEALLLGPARRLASRRFVVAGPQYPSGIRWGGNVERIDHLPPHEHRAFYNRMRFTLNVTRRDMIRAGYSPSVRLFEAAACGTPILSDGWEGLGSIFEVGTEIRVVSSADEAFHVLTTTSEEERQAIGMRARERVLAQHSAKRRAAELETYLLEAREAKTTRSIGRRSATWQQAEQSKAETKAQESRAQWLNP